MNSPIGLSKKTISQIKSVTSLIGKSTILPILENGLIQKNELIFTDLESSVVFKNINIPGEICIPATALNNVLKLMPEFVTEITDNNIAFISPDGSERLKTATEPAEDFPRLPDIKDPVIQGTLTDATIAQLKIAENFVGRDELRPNMMCVAFDKGHIVSTDAHRLYFDLADFKPTEPLLIPLKARKLIQLFHDTQDPLQVSTTDFTVILENASVKILFRKVDERYPDWQAVIPAENPNGLIIATDILTGPLAKAISQANQTTHQIRFKLTKEPANLTISSEDIDFKTEYSKDFGRSAEVYLPKIDELEIGFNGNFLAEILKFTGDVTTIKMSTPSRGALINGKFLLMPVMLNGYS